MPPRGSTKRRRGRVPEAAAAAEDDALLSLPPDALDEILTRLGVRDAVRTSALSRAWRRRWETLPFLDLCFPRPGVGDGGAPVGLGAVDGILLRFPGRVRRFSVEVDDTCAGRIHDWLCVLSRRGVEILNLSFIGTLPTLPSSVFSCSRLTSLRLSQCSIPLLPQGFVTFPELRRLTLECVWLQEYGEYQLEEIIHTSPLLEHLYLTEILIDGGGENLSKRAIRAPNVRYLTACSEICGVYIPKELPSLYSATILLQDFVVQHKKVTAFLSGLVQVTKLLIVLCNVPPSAMTPKRFLRTFHNLKSLTTFLCFGKQPHIMLTLCLLKSAPNLEELNIEILLYEEKLEFEANVEFLNALWTDGMCANLQVVQMIGINWRPNEMSFIELILSKARRLHTLAIRYGEKLLMSTEDALNELATYKIASDEAQVFVEGRET